MKALAFFVALLLAGCATTREPDARLVRLQARSQEIAVRAQRCIRAAKAHGNASAARILASPDAFSPARIKETNEERDREVVQCRAEEARENHELSAREAQEYSLQGQQERERASLMMILTTSRPH